MCVYNVVVMTHMSWSPIIPKENLASCTLENAWINLISYGNLYIYLLDGCCNV